MDEKTIRLKENIKIKPL